MCGWQGGLLPSLLEQEIYSCLTHVLVVCGRRGGLLTYLLEQQIIPAHLTLWIRTKFVLLVCDVVAQVRQRLEEVKKKKKGGEVEIDHVADGESEY